MRLNEKPASGFISESWSDGSGQQSWTWSWNLILGRLLSIAENRYGKRSHEKAILGIHFGGTNPETWCYNPGDTECVSIRLSLSAANDHNCAFSELAHEVIHLLCPGGRDTNLLEEGLAVVFSEDMRSEFGYPPAPRNNYEPAAQAVTELLVDHPDCIKKIRSEHEDLRTVTSDYLMSTLKIPQSLADTLVLPFY